MSEPLYLHNYGFVFGNTDGSVRNYLRPSVITPDGDDRWLTRSNGFVHPQGSRLGYGAYIKSTPCGQKTIVAQANIGFDVREDLSSFTELGLGCEIIHYGTASLRMELPLRLSLNGMSDVSLNILRAKIVDVDIALRDLLVHAVSVENLVT